MDVAHNSPALRSMVKTVKSMHEGCRLYVVLSMSIVKNIRSSLMTLMNEAADIKFAIVDHFRLIKESDASEQINALKFSNMTNALRIHDIKDGGNLETSIKTTFESINRKQEENAVFVFCGSVFIMEFVRDVFKIPQIKDKEGLNAQSG